MGAPFCLSVLWACLMKHFLTLLFWEFCLVSCCNPFPWVSLWVVALTHGSWLRRFWWSRVQICELCVSLAWFWILFLNLGACLDGLKSNRVYRFVCLSCHPWKRRERERERERGLVEKLVYLFRRKDGMLHAYIGGKVMLIWDCLVGRTTYKIFKKENISCLLGASIGWILSDIL